ncbi:MULTISPECIES: hypothetical protein [unclassified Duganella]|uniref:hypothetical protein n=1 Tax=unclassified Duganella TaxID=2636909 RepID=UPI00087EFF33|nr:MULTISPECIES: hypothetical protein [unclassified Duganella]SDF80858.1 hypothetical protein SAMN05216320_1011387 [Duganella sp. OV458]SDI48506.1 hypothetical protein SAMN05428973_10128 [Duganella sp. OV510]
MSKDDNKAVVTLMPQAEKNARRAELEKTARHFRDNIDLHREMATLLAQITRAKYLALVEQGFSEDQALSLCRS